jgi:hypothetical protein
MASRIGLPVSSGKTMMERDIEFPSPWARLVSVLDLSLG